jgi:hypothetical protein
MAKMSDFTLAHQDEFPHQPDGNSNFNESVFVNGYDHTHKMGGWMRIGNRANEGHAEMQVCLYLPGNRIACNFQRPKITDNKQFAAGGLKYDVVEPFKKVNMSYEGELLILNDPNMLRIGGDVFSNAPRVKGSLHWENVAISPIHGGIPLREDVIPLYGRNFSLNHFNQHTKVTGKIVVGDESWEFKNGWGWRDHSWGPRYWQNIFFHRLFMINFSDGRGAMLLKITDPDGKARRVGCLLADGDYEDILDMDLVTHEWTSDKDPISYTITARTPKRTAVIKGRIVTGAPLRNRRKVDDKTLIQRIFEASTEFEWDGVKGFGQSEYIERIENDKLVGYPL